MVKKRGRVKTFATLVKLDNQLKRSTKRGLHSFKRPVKLPDGTWSISPFRWRRLNSATDMGPNMVCAHSVCIYKLKLNYNEDYDLSHGSQRDNTLTIDHTGEKNHQHLAVSAMNCLHSSRLAPARLAQFRESINEYLDHVDHNTCPILVDNYEDIIRQRGLQISVASDTAMQVCGIICIRMVKDG